MTSAAFALLIIADSEASAFSATLGIPVIVVGLILRAYSVAFLGTDSPTQRSRENKSMVTSGPFKLVRYPAYIGTFLTTCGLAVYSGDGSTCLLVLIFQLIQYKFITDFEDDQMLGNYTEDFSLYKTATPKWLPKFPLDFSFFEFPEHFGALLKQQEKFWFIGCGLTILILAVFN